jgi:hypothetical protein
MFGRPKINAAAPIRSSFADAAFAVEERLVWGGIDLLRGLLDAVKWPFERAVWTLERGLVWPLEERTDGWSGSLRASGAVALALLAAGAGVLGLLWASGSGSGSATHARTVSAPAVTAAPVTAPAKAAPVLHGPAPSFTPEAGGGVAKSETGSVAKAAEPVTSSTVLRSGNGTDAAVPAGPAATAVAHHFANAFVLYEIGKDSAKVRKALDATATPRLAHSLLRRPPRLPANVEVPKAKVLNIVPGPKHGDTYTMSVSLLRLGITSELRIDMQQDEDSGEWHVADVRG